jgi:RimJ/RimL family protein N-acetyltransferase
MRLNSLSLCDGLGLFRVTHLINQLSANSNNVIVLRPAIQSDTKQVFDWQLLPETRKHALTQSVPTWEVHQNWMKTKLDKTSDYFYIIESLTAGQNIGVVRLDKQSAGQYLISIFIDPNYFGQGYAKQALAYVDLLHPNMTIEATVLTKNHASQRLFTSASYQQVSAESFIRSPLK